MRFDAATVAALAALTQALDEPGTDIATTVGRLGRVMAATVPSFTALSFRTGSGSTEIKFTGRSDAHEDLDGICTSLLIPLPDGGTDGDPEQSGSALVVYAGQPGAFVDLAADISWLTGFPLESFRLDEHLQPPAGHGSVTALRDASTINQAVGVLIERGLTVEEALHHLEHLAVVVGVDKAAAAAALLGQLVDGGAAD